MTRPRVVLKRIDAGITGAKNSVEIDQTDNKVELVGDQETPGNFKLYGTDGTGTKGWHERSARKELELDINVWNMGSTAFVLVPHTLTPAQEDTVHVLSVKIFRDDYPSNTEVKPLNCYDEGGMSGVMVVFEGDIWLGVHPTSQFAVTGNYNGTSINRGKVLLTYIP